MKHILSIQTQNKPEVLFKITGLLQRKCFIVDSLIFNSTSKDPNISNIKISIVGDKTTIKRAINQLKKIIEVISIRFL